MADRDHSIEVYRSWADQAWQEHRSSDSGQCDSRAYAAGFKDGFVDYVYGGGSGEPPPVPPRPFWNVDIRNPRGHTEATNWFAGYRNGAQVARDEGYRRRALVPLSMFLMGMQEEENGSNDRHYSEEAYGVPYGKPLAHPISEPLQPEFATPNEIPQEATPRADSKTYEPEQLPALPKPTRDLPDFEAPSFEPPDTETQAIEPPAEERLPQPPIVPEESLMPQQPAPIESPPEETRPPTDIEDLFGPTATSHRRRHQPQPLRKANFEKAIPRGVSVQQARSAFASAIRSRGVTRNTSNDTPPIATASITRKRAATSRHPRPATIPKSQDRAQEMFRRLSN